MEDILSLLQKRDQKFEKSNNDEKIQISQRYLDLNHNLEELTLSKATISAKLTDLQTNGMSVGGDVDISTLNSQLVDLYRERSQLSNESKELDSQIEALQNNKAVMHQNIIDITNEKAKIEESILKLGKERITIEQKLDEVNNELSIVTQKYQEIERESVVLQETLDMYRQKVIECAEFIKEAEKNSPRIIPQKLLTSIDAHSSQINSICFGPGYQSFYTVGDDKKLIQWSLPSLTEMINVPTRGIVNSIRYQRESNVLALSCQDKTVRILDSNTGRIISELSNHTDQATDSIWISRNQLLSSSKDRTVKLFDITKNAVVTTVMAISASFGLCETNSPSVFACGCFDGHIRLIDMRQKSVAMKIEKVHTRPALSLAAANGGETVLSIGLDGALCESSIRAGTRVRARTDPRQEVRSYQAKLAASPDAAVACVPSARGCHLLYDLYSGGPPAVVEDSQPCVCAAYAANMVITGTAKHCLNFFA